MRGKTLWIVIAVILLALASGLGAIWFMNQGQKHPDRAAERREARQEANLTSKVEVFNLALPCKPETSGAVAVAHADIVIEVPLKYRLKIEDSNSKLRDIISTIFRSTSIADLNADSDLKNIKQRIVDKVKADLDIDIQDILFLRFEYDVLEPK